MKTNNNKRADESFKYIRDVTNALFEISNKKEANEIAKEACRQIANILGTDSCSLSRWDKEKNTIKLWAEVISENEALNPAWLLPYNLDDYPLTKKVLMTGEPQQIRVDDQNVDKAELKLLHEFDAKTLIMLPLITNNEIIGLVEIFDSDLTHTFTDNDIALILVLLKHVGVSITQVNLLKEANQRAAELSAIREVNLGLTSNQSLDDVFNVILKSSLNLFSDAIDAHIFIYEQEKLYFGAALWADGRKSGPIAEPRENGITYTVARKAEIRVVEDFSTDSLFKDNPTKWEGAIIGLPLKNQDRVVGVMNIAFKEPRQFDKDVLGVLSLLGGQAAVAIERSHNVELIKKRAAELEALRQANLALTASLDLEDVISTVLKSALKFSEDAMDAHIFIKEGDDLVFGGALWANGKTETTWKQPRKNGLTNTVFNSGKIITVPNAMENDLYAETKKLIDGENFEAIVGLPIIAKDTVIGVMNLAYNTPQLFSEADLRSLALLSDQAALAIENARLHQIVSKQAVTDALTGLPNRRAFQSQLKKEVLRSKRYHHQFVLVMMDLNNFKWVNDTFGHPVGDKTLKMVGSFLKKNIRETDFIARLGGDEFGMIMTETNKDNAVTRTKKITKKFMDHSFPWWKDNKENFVLKLIVGFAGFPEDAGTAEELTLIADQNFYKAKKKAAKQ